VEKKTKGTYLSTLQIFLAIVVVVVIGLSLAATQRTTIKLPHLVPAGFLLLSGGSALESRHSWRSTGDPARLLGLLSPP